MIRRTTNDLEKLFQLLLHGKFNENNCFEWQLACDKNGYGISNYINNENKTRSWKVHRLIWHILVGEIPEKLLVCHACDNPKCFNVNHLFIGSPKENSQDREKKGRGRIQLGELNVMSCLSEIEVLLIRKKYSEGMRICDLVIEFKRNQATISKIVHRNRWKHI